jgi:hypothetical protein
MTDALFRVLLDGVPGLARGTLADGPRELLPASTDVDEILAGRQ